MPPDIDTWVLDLDNTLYPPSTGLAGQMNDRIHEYLRNHFGIDAADYLAFEHRIDYSVLRPHGQLAAAITALPGRKFAFSAVRPTVRDRASSDGVLEA